jgi:hypothetical protein
MPVELSKHRSRVGKPGLDTIKPAVVQHQPTGSARTVAVASLTPKHSEAVHFDAITVRVAQALAPIQHALRSHWDFLYRRADPLHANNEPGVEFTLKRTSINGVGVQAGIAALESKGMKPESEKVVVFGGGYEVDLGPLLDRFKEVHVVDLCPEPLALAARKYATHPHRARLKMVTADLSGIPVAYQQKELSRAKSEIEANGVPSVDGIARWFAGMPKTLDAVPFDTAAYAMVVAPVLHESLPFGPAVAAFEQARVLQAERTHAPVDRKAIDTHVGEEFYYRPAVHDTTLRIFQHNRDELQRITKPGGVCVFSSWMRPDEHQEALAPDAPKSLVRVGDSRMTQEEWTSLFHGWQGSQQLHKEQIYPGKAPTLNLFLLERGDEPHDEAGPTSKRAALHMRRFAK